MGLSKGTPHNFIIFLHFLFLADRILQGIQTKSSTGISAPSPIYIPDARSTLAPIPAAVASSAPVRVYLVFLIPAVIK